MRVYMCAYARGGQRSMPGIFLYAILFFEPEYLTGPGACPLTRVSGQSIALIPNTDISGILCRHSLWMEVLGL